MQADINELSKGRTEERDVVNYAAESPSMPDSKSLLSPPDRHPIKMSPQRMLVVRSSDLLLIHLASLLP